jgi:hypothetical protein
MVQQLSDTRLRYVKAANVKVGSAILGGFDVRDTAGCRLGRLAGLIFDGETERLRYVVVAAFRGIETEQGVLPVHSARLDPSARALVLLEFTAAA